MEKLLSMDISSSTIGWSLFEFDKNTINLLSYGHIKPPNKAKADKLGYGLSYRLSEISKEIKNLITKTQPDKVAVEDYAKKFSAGRSSANTIIILATVNETVSLVCFQMMGIEVTRLPVTRLRSVVKKKYQVDVKDKDDAMKLIKQVFPIFSSVLNKNGNTKKECYDESDAAIVGLGYHILL